MTALSNSPYTPDLRGYIEFLEAEHPEQVVRIKKEVDPKFGVSGILERLERDGKDVVLADLRLPDMSAIDVLRQLQMGSFHPPFVVVTGFGSTASAVEAMRLGATDFIEKPLIGEELIRVVEQALPASASASRRRNPASPSISKITGIRTPVTRSIS